MHITFFNYIRQRAAGDRVHGTDASKPTSKAIPAPDANAELVISIQVTWVQVSILCGV
jgi:hypothetical protein